MTAISAEIRPSRVEIPQADLDDLQTRLALTRFADEIPGVDQGVGVERVRRLVTRWRTGFDWRAQEARLNALPQFTTEIDGQRIHFLHVRSANPDALPLILTHGWPGSIAEYLDAVEPLSRHHHLVIPSLPGFGFSGPTTETGWDNVRVARAWAELMGRLGYDRYGAVGNDAGSMISPELARLAPDHVVGVHVTQIFSFPSGDPAEFAGLSEEDQQGLAVLDWFWKEKGAFNVLHSQQPQTLAHAIADSPAGLVGWLAQLFDEDLDDDFVLLNAAIHWFTGTAGSALRLYWENARAQQSGEQAAKEPTTVPMALAMAEGDFKSIRAFAERDHAGIVSWKTLPAPAHGHYTAHTATDALTSDIHAFFAGLS
ncbi:epoxide hydrolase family protein [Nonomuraea roseoviolacea]|uniref:Pimeloyl-ACP methyl ester carboxylesterase n=1 Tax=Nonomuraea roseoviolacea subsp. carminata TaxID=160689 RepID=A0ABT1JXD4_9ACTN|nr:epoxide hydrolase [Nonomuraea roseoviolacea]MCP2345906.1 pimeloyl-ACP methyl ester carboxylesterase [Nonomuraea roseoviolacea subsp. carminata]